MTRAGADSCKGDSGGPLVCDINGSLTLMGLVSKGRMCNKEGFPGIYTNVQTFRTWLDESKFERISSVGGFPRNFNFVFQKRLSSGPNGVHVT